MFIHDVGGIDCWGSVRVLCVGMTVRAACCAEGGAASMEANRVAFAKSVMKHVAGKISGTCGSGSTLQVRAASVCLSGFPFHCVVQVALPATPTMLGGSVNAYVTDALTLRAQGSNRGYLGWGTTKRLALCLCSRRTSDMTHTIGPQLFLGVGHSFWVLEVYLLGI